MAADEARVWDRFAGNYDRTVRHFDRSYPEVAARLREDLAGRARVLEVAAGTGQFSFALAEVAGEVLATDGSPEMVKRLAAKVAARGVGNLSTAVMSSYALDVDDGSLDGVVCANALHVMASPERALGEFRRALRPGGRLVVPTFCHGATWRARLLSRLASLVSSFEVHTRFTPASLERMVAAAGFAVRSVARLPGKFPLAYVVADR